MTGQKQQPTSAQKIAAKITLWQNEAKNIWPKTRAFVKRKPKTSIATGIVALLALLVWWGMQPITGSMYYGVCRVFTQSQLRYPDTMKVVAADVFAAEWRIYYTFRDAFGSERSEMMKCIFGPAQNEAGFKIDEAVLSRGTKRTSISQDILEPFNQTIPAVIAAEPDLVLPWKAGDSLKELQHK
jgi:hypothetical protein